MRRTSQVSYIWPLQLKENHFHQFYKSHLLSLFTSGNYFESLWIGSTKAAVAQEVERVVHWPVGGSRLPWKWHWTPNCPWWQEVLHCMNNYFEVLWVFYESRPVPAVVDDSGGNQLWNHCFFISSGLFGALQIKWSEVKMAAGCFFICSVLCTLPSLIQREPLMALVALSPSMEQGEALRMLRGVLLWGRGRSLPPPPSSLPPPLLSDSVWVGEGLVHRWRPGGCRQESTHTFFTFVASLRINRDHTSCSLLFITLIFLVASS